MTLRPLIQRGHARRAGPRVPTRLDELGSASCNDAVPAGDGNATLGNAIADCDSDHEPHGGSASGGPRTMSECKGALSRRRVSGRADDVDRAPAPNASVATGTSRVGFAMSNQAPKTGSGAHCVPSAIVAMEPGGPGPEMVAQQFVDRGAGATTRARDALADQPAQPGYGTSAEGPVDPTRARVAGNAGIGNDLQTGAGEET